MPRTVQDTDDAERPICRIVHDEIAPVRMYNPKTKRQRSQVLPRLPQEGRIGKKIAGAKNRCLNAVSSFAIISGYEVPDVEEVGLSLGREPIFFHSLGGSPKRALFSSLSWK
ncbi:MAG: hypothetical protein WAN65_28055 [Candidatus Sulfotelmatobacter sp.]